MLPGIFESRGGGCAAPRVPLLPIPCLMLFTLFSHKGPSINHIDRFWDFFDPSLPLCRQFYYIGLFSKVDIWPTPSPQPCLRGLWKPPNECLYQHLLGQTRNEKWKISFGFIVWNKVNFDEFYRNFSLFTNPEIRKSIISFET